MAVSFTYHGRERATDGSGKKADALRKPKGNRTDVADSAASSAVATSGWHRITASTTSYVAVGSAVTNGTNGAHFPAGHTEVWWIDAGDKIGCSAGV